MRPLPLNKAHSARPWRSWYTTPEWQSIRAQQLAIEPWCRFCARDGIRTKATTVDHVERHNGDRGRFFGGPFQSLCKPCHDREKQGQELRGYSTKIGADGLPLDPSHPFNRSAEK